MKFLPWLREKWAEGLAPDQMQHIRFGFHVLFRSRSRTRGFVPLRLLRPIPRLEHASARAKTATRVANLRAELDRLLATGRIDAPTLQRLMPSPSPIMAVRDRDGAFVTFNGNGRVFALLEIFSPEQRALAVEIEIFEPKAPEYTLARLARVKHTIAELGLG